VLDSLGIDFMSLVRIKEQIKVI